MKINLEILDAAYLYDEKTITQLNTKELVPKMVFRRRLTQASKLVIELMHKINFSTGRILYGTAWGELKSTANILNAILNKDMVSPTDFQNSVYNTAVSYSSILSNNKNEILTISSGNNTSLNLLKAGAIKALDKDEILLICTETINIENIEQTNNCIDYLEVAVALKVKISDEKATIDFKEIENKGFPKSVNELLSIAKLYNQNSKNIVEIKL
ncbi:beta-ketoacyl synthase chain length factor [Arcobacter sp.]|uniref:beta-ketoacyl synthase chain length factor n=1 Tax=Arcobacter sp. TaxID=1872629 RepID=UPI003D108B12